MHRHTHTRPSNTLGPHMSVRASWMNTGTCLDWKCCKEGINKEKLRSFCHFNEYTVSSALYQVPPCSFCISFSITQ